MAVSNGKSSGSWKAWKSCVAWWIKAILIGIALGLGVMIGLFVAYKAIHAARVSSLNAEIGKAKAQLEALSY
jgi:hypothetical protein